MVAFKVHLFCRFFGLRHLVIHLLGFDRHLHLCHLGCIGDHPRPCGMLEKSRCSHFIVHRYRLEGGLHVVGVVGDEVNRTRLRFEHADLDAIILQSFDREFIISCDTGHTLCSRLPQQRTPGTHRSASARKKTPLPTSCIPRTSPV